MHYTKKLSIILPVLNEEKAIKICLENLLRVITEQKLEAEIIVVDNNSTDQSFSTALEMSGKFDDFRIIQEKSRGYGSAYMKGFSIASGEYIYMADCDNTYDFTEISDFIKKLADGYDLVVGNRFSGQIEKGAMHIHKRYLGNPILSFLTKLFFGIKIHDVHCGARAIRKETYNQLDLYTTGMEFASEMIIKAAKRKKKITEIPIKYRKRIGESKLESLGDGWRHLRFILLYSPLVLFLIPGILLFLVGTFFMIIFYFGNPKILGIELFYHPMFLFSAIVIVGYQLILFSMFAKIYSITHLKDSDPTFEKLFKIFTIERAGGIGIVLAIIGTLIYGVIFINWIQSGLGSLNEAKNSILALTLIVIGFQTFFGAFMLSTLGIKEK